MMSGTSADGIDVALVAIDNGGEKLSAVLLGCHRRGFKTGLREAIFRAFDAKNLSLDAISALNFQLGEEFAQAALEACRKWRIPISAIDLIGSHGQTVFHRGQADTVRGTRLLPSTLQIGEPSIIAARTGVATIADFRPADMAAGGQGAPLVPYVDYLLYRDERRGRVALNIGGIANISVIPAGAGPRGVIAFDTGPGNMIVDALTEWATHGRAKYDRDARIALRGETIPQLLAKLMREPYLRRKPPKTAGREQFGRAYADGIIRWAKKHRARPGDVVRTATVFTSLSIADALHRFVLPHTRVDELIATGGGAQNPLMMAQLAAELPGVQISPASDWGVPAEAKEAFAFAILAYEAFHGRPNNLPSATGASRPVVMGKLVHGRPR